ncbi:type IX secretion system protein PorQ [Tenacibaculum sp. M341]|uniref:type IX secretion system protein PorQ n=1 Tax=Tenacibaculum sp. M341 TaxID=2530339 RepID=UPI00105069A3|nr:type IX secretion system protein PorQ [Tenacibaculum sp. M341]TCI85248.1 type IX secretion system protein PorQ [Tenacibaculum sp. M341]
MRKIYIYFLIFFPFIIQAQTGGTNAFSFLNTSTNARQTALGGKIFTLVDDVDQPKWNPASINLDIDRKLSVNYTGYLADISIGSVSYAHRFSRYSKTIHSNITYLNYGTLIAADADGTETGTFNASDIALSVGYAYQIPNTDIHVGANFKFIYSTIASFSSTGIAGDLGIMYYTPHKPYIFSLVLRNIGTQLSSFNGTSEKLPFEIALGASYMLENVPIRGYLTIDNLQKWNVSVPNPSNSTSDLDGNTTEENISFLNNAFRHVIIGAELFPKRAINLRVGYNFRRGSELQLQNVRTFGGISFGFGLRMNKIKINYAYSKFHFASDVSTFGISIDLNKERSLDNKTKY